MSDKWRNTYFWLKKSDKTSWVYLFSLWKTLEKQTRTIESNELIKKDF